MKPGEIAEILRQTNSWWRKPQEGWTREDPDLRTAAEARFFYEPRPLDGLIAGGLYILRGPRRVGKSVELKRSIANLLRRGVEPRRVIHAAVEGWRDADLGGLVRVGREQVTRGLEGPRYWFIDEITGVVGDWPNRIKWLRDNTALREDCVVLTGSSAERFDDAVKALAGRRGDAVDSDRTLLPMGFGAFCRAIGLDLPWPAALDASDLQRTDALECFMNLQAHLNDLVDAWESYLTIGGFPRAVDDYLRAGDVRPAFLEALWAVVYGDAILRQRFSATQTQGLLAALARNLASPLNVNGLAAELSAGRDAVAARLEELATGYLIWPCHLSDRGTPKLRAQSKRYFTDPLLARLAAARRPGAAAPDLTKLSEQQVGMALLRQATRQDPGSYPRFEHVLYYRTATRSEIDFVSGGRSAVPVESKYVDGPWRRDAQTLRAAFGRGIVATRSVLEVDDDVWAVPAPLVALSLEPG